ncbi:MAG: DUF4276 family protein [Betaproteobacteria bacterium]|nr:DUF4276 family protein [Betaproteobacteria bacterium]
MTLLVPIVEGHGEVQAVPALLHRLALQANAGIPVRVNPPIRVKSGSFLNDPDYFRRQFALAAAKAAQARGHVLILLDCEDDCPAELGPELLRRGRAVRADVSVHVFLAHREYETWFIAAAASLRGHAGLPSDLVPPADPELTRDAKGWLSQRMPQPYDPIVHQLDFTRAFDLEQARTNDSFRRIHDQIRNLLAP